jgi:hypothetical protein
MVVRYCRPAKIVRRCRGGAPPTGVYRSSSSALAACLPALRRPASSLPTSAALKTAGPATSRTTSTHRRRGFGDSRFYLMERSDGLHFAMREVQESLVGRERRPGHFLSGDRHNRRVATRKLIMADSRGAIVRASVVAHAAA